MLKGEQDSLSFFGRHPLSTCSPFLMFENMQRIIKFRAWHKTYKNEDGEQMFGVQGFYTSLKGKEYVNLIGADAIVQLWNWAGTERMENVVLMQFTGLYDKKNKKEIYEGDIVEITSNNYTKEIDKELPEHKKPQRIGVIQYRDDRAAFELDRSLRLGDSGGHNLQLFANGDFKIEVIGNIYENPELLK